MKIGGWKHSPKTGGFWLKREGWNLLFQIVNSIHVDLKTDYTVYFNYFTLGINSLMKIISILF